MDDRQIDRIHTNKETAAILRVSIKTLWRMKRRGDIKWVKITDRIEGHTDSQIAAFLKSRECA
jgi:hypothetical protein